MQSGLGSLQYCPKRLSHPQADGSVISQSLLGSMSVPIAVILRAVLSRFFQNGIHVPSEQNKKAAHAAKGSPVLGLPSLSMVDSRLMNGRGNGIHMQTCDLPDNLGIDPGAAKRSIV
jgi:hypothetical protein